MLDEMRYIDGELLPMLRENASKTKTKAKKQLAQWNGEENISTLMLKVHGIKEQDILPDYNLEEIHYDSEKMFISQLKGALSAALANGDAVPSVRSNMGCGIFPTMFGLKQEIYPDKMPWLINHLDKETLSKMTPDDLVETPEYKKALEHMRYMKEKLEGTGIEVYPMDVQGTVDVAHLVYGDNFFYDLYDDPEFVHHLMSLSNACIIKGMHDCLDIIQPKDYVAHYNMLVLPADKPIKISEDTSTLLSHDHIKNITVKYCNELLEEFGGGYVHYCGKNDHLYNACIYNMPKNLSLNFGNPEMHNMAVVLQELAQNNVCYIGSNFTIDELPKILKSSYHNKRFHLFTDMSCHIDEQDEAIDRFNEMVYKIIKE
jgi:hypothetical protein